MKYCYINNAVQLADERDDLLKLRTAAMTNTVTLAAGTKPTAIDSEEAANLIDMLLTKNKAALLAIGVTDVFEWRIPQRPPERIA